MTQSIKSVMTEKKAMADAIGMIALVLILITAVGILIGNYAVHTKKVELFTAVSQGVANRAETYAAAMNEDLVHTAVPSLARECTVTTQVCTQILGVTPAADGASVVLRIQGDTVAPMGESVTKDVTLESTEVTHVTAIDKDGNNTWGLAEEGLRFKTWGVASGEPSTVKPVDLATSSVTWVSVADRAGVDSRGGLWVWGPNDIGQAGDGTVSSTPITPHLVDTGETTFRSVTTTDNRGYAIDSQGFAWVWGKNDKGQLGKGDALISTPTKLKVRVNTLVGGLDNTIGITTSGDLWMTGVPQKGLPAPDADGIVNKGTQYRAVAASPAGNGIALIDANGKLSATSDKFTFAPATGDVTFAQVSLGETHGAAVSSDGRLFVFGTTTRGAMGTGLIGSSRAPKEVEVGKRFVTVTAGRYATFAVDTTGKLSYAGSTNAGSTDFALPKADWFTPLLENTLFRSVAADGVNSRTALLDTAGNVYGVGAETAGLWSIDYRGSTGVPVRMPKPDGFSSYTSEKQ